MNFRGENYNFYVLEEVSSRQDKKKTKNRFLSSSLLFLLRFKSLHLPLAAHFPSIFYGLLYNVLIILLLLAKLNLRFPI